MTWSLIFFSYSLNYMPVGAAVMILHDLTDLSVTMFKLTVDVTHIVIQSVFYVILLVSWVYLRLWYFPVHVTYRLHEECYQDVVCRFMQYQPLNMMTSFLWGLFCLHIFWFYLMVKGFLKRIRSKDGNAVFMKSSANVT